MIQDIAPKKLYNEYSDEPPRLQDICFIFDNSGNVFANELSGHVEFPTYGMVSSKSRKNTYLFCIDDIRYYLVDASLTRYGFRYIPVRELRFREPKHSVFALMTAYHLYTWYRDNRYCGRCGKELVHDTSIRALNCSCSNQVFPKISPAVIVAVVNDNKLLMTKYRGRHYKNYALIAGFAEIGETLEETVEREVMEETGLRVSRIRYFGSQPWGVDSNLLVGFFARLDGDDTIDMDGDELSEAGWFRRDEINMQSDGVSLTTHMIQAFKDGYTG